jgi:hypothetical protein
MCNTYCFSTATLLTRTRLNFTFIRTCLVNIQGVFEFHINRVDINT